MKRIFILIAIVLIGVIAYDFHTLKQASDYRESCNWLVVKFASNDFSGCEKVADLYYDQLIILNLFK